MLVYLIGMPGSGKTTFGRLLAEKLSLQFIDLDNRIEKEDGRSIPDIFEEEGEHYFRILERKILRGQSKVKSALIATGGGAPCFFDNMDYINQTGISIFLDVSVATLADRVMLQRGQRPLLNDATLATINQALEHKRSQRIKFYKQAHFKLSEKEIDIDKAIKKLKFDKIKFHDTIVYEATINELYPLAILFDQYRVFYKKKSSVEDAEKFLSERIENEESTIFIAEHKGKIVGFTQLYPIFSSVRMKKQWLLNDLYVSEEVRNKHIGHLLIKKAQELCMKTNSCGLVLETEISNKVAQHLYKETGFKRDEEHYFYSWDI